jgi:hypothetical protein
MAFLRKHKKFLSATAAFLVILSGLVALSLPRLINLKMLKSRLVASLSERVNGKVDYRSVELGLWPLPHLILHQPRITIPATLTGRASALLVYPAIRPLLTGELRPRAVAIESPQINYFLKAERLPSGLNSGHHLTVHQIENALDTLMRRHVSGIPALRIQLTNGQVSLIHDQKPLFDCSRLQFSGVMDHDKFQVDLECVSSLFETFKGHVSGNSVARTLQADFQLRHFHPADLFQSCFPQGLYGWTVDSRSDLNLNAALIRNDQKIFETRIHSFDSKLVLAGGRNRQAFEVAVFEGLLQSCDETITLACEELRLKRPAVTLQGRYQFIPDLHHPHVIEIKGENAETAAIRDSILAFGKDNLIVRLIFSIVREGDVPSISFTSQAKSFVRLWHPAVFHLQGEMNHGKIYIPRAKLHLHNVQGTVDIADCVLHAENMSATLGNSRGYEGDLKLGLLQWDAPFHLTLGLDVDLSGLPPILKRVVPINAFQHELNMIDQVQGHARGHLTLGERLFKIRPQIEVEQFELSGRYQRLPFPLHASGGHFTLDPQQITGRDVSLRVGTSHVEEVSWRLNLASPFPLHFQAGRHSFALKELFPWLCEYPEFQANMKALASLEGRLSDSRLQGNGPFSAPHQWKLQAVTSLENVSFRLPAAACLPGTEPDPVRISSGILRISPDVLSFDELKTAVMDASFNLSGSIKGYRSGLNQMEINGSGMLHSRSYQWLAATIPLPQALSPRLPLQISNVQLQWQHDGNAVFQGRLKPPSGKAFTVGWERIAGSGRQAAKIMLNDQYSQSTIDYIFSPGIREVAFNGYLHASTLDQILRNNQVLEGWIKGNFRAHLLKPQKISAYGNLHGQSIRIPGAMPDSGWIEFFDLTADSNRITLAPTALKFKKMTTTLSGDIRFLKDRIQVDLSAAAGHLDGNDLHRLFNRREESSSPDTHVTGLMSACPVRGVIHLKAEHFQYNAYTWQPFHADIHLENGHTEIDVITADLCGVSMPGRIQIFPHQLSIAIQPSAEQQDMNHAVSCLLNQKDLITGKFDLQGGMEAVADLHHLKNAFVGTLEFKAGDGRIYRLNLLAKILALLNVTELLRGKVPDVIEEGFRYDKLESHVEINNGSVLVLSDGILDAPSMKLIFEGDVDLKQQTIDLTILVAPFQTINFIIEHIPLVGGILGGSLYAIPLRAEGELNDPKIRLLSSSKISSRLIDTMKRTLQIPVELIKPLFDQEPEKNNKQ